MREIKFRAVTDAGMFIVPSPEFSLQIADTGHTVIVWSSDGHIDEIPVKSLDRFTGLHDKNGKEVYENDVVKPVITSSEKGGWYSSDKAQGVVEFNDEWGLRFVCKDHSQRTAAHWKTKACTPKQASKIRIIGNIHEHPELMENPK